ncbi:MAG: tetratricopeptide repeat protein [Candidatus Methanofastidiosia archaeon]
MKRTKEHVLETESRRALESLLPPEWIFRVKILDYGIDVEIEIVEGEEVTNKVLWIQLKATESMKGKVSYKMRTDYLKYYEGCPLPVVILYWTKSENNFYYIFAQEYIDKILSKNNPDWRRQKTVTIIFDSKLENIEELKSTATEGYYYVIKQRLHLEHKVTTILSPISRLCLGRDQELSQLEKDLEHKNILLIKGIAGIGKTTLGLKFRDKLEERGYETFWHHFDSQSYESLLLGLSDYLKSRGAIAAVRLKSQEIIPEERLRIAVQELCNYPTVLFLDNFQVFENDLDFRIFTDYMRNSHLIVMSRTQPKFLSEEYENLQYLDRDSSVELLRALEVKEPQDVLEKIYEKTKGHPWSLVCFKELSRILPVRTLLEELPDFGKKQKAYIFEECWKNLSDSEREFLMRSSVFRKPLSFDALRVCSKTGLSEVLTSLAESFYILKRGENYYIHDIIRDFAFSKLKENKELYVEAQRKAAEHYERDLSAENLLSVHYHLKEAGENRKGIDLLLKNIKYFWQEGFWSDIRKVLEESLDFINDKERMARICNSLGTIIVNLGEWDKALNYYEKSLRIFEDIGDIHGMAMTYCNIGAVYYQEGEWDKALECHEKDLRISKELGNKHDIALAYGNLGLVYHGKGELDKALECHEKCLEVSEKAGDTYGMAMAYGNLGLVYYDNGELDKALEYHKKDLEIYEEMGDTHGIARAYCNLGEAYHRKGEWNLAIECNKKSLKILKEMGDIYGMALIYRNTGDISFIKKEYNQALDWYLKASEIFGKLGAKNELKITKGKFLDTYEKLVRKL